MTSLRAICCALFIRSVDYHPYTIHDLQDNVDKVWECVDEKSVFPHDKIINIPREYSEDESKRAKDHIYKCVLFFPILILSLS